jgi:hypothetical protein
LNQALFWQIPGSIVLSCFIKPGNPFYTAMKRMGKLLLDKTLSVVFTSYSEVQELSQSPLLIESVHRQGSIR